MCASLFRLCGRRFFTLRHLAWHIGIMQISHRFSVVALLLKFTRLSQKIAIYKELGISVLKLLFCLFVSFLPESLLCSL